MIFDSGKSVFAACLAKMTEGLNGNLPLFS